MYSPWRRDTALYRLRPSGKLKKSTLLLKKEGWSRVCVKKRRWIVRVKEMICCLFLLPSHLVTESQTQTLKIIIRLSSNIMLCWICIFFFSVFLWSLIEFVVYMIVWLLFSHDSFLMNGGRKVRKRKKKRLTCFFLDLAQDGEKSILHPMTVEGMLPVVRRSKSKCHWLWFVQSNPHSFRSRWQMSWCRITNHKQEDHRRTSYGSVVSSRMLYTTQHTRGDTISMMVIIMSIVIMFQVEETMSRRCRRVKTVWWVKLRWWSRWDR